MFSRILFIGFVVLFVAKPADTFAWMGDPTPEMIQLEISAIKMDLRRWDTAYELQRLGQKRNAEWRMRHSWVLKTSYWSLLDPRKNPPSDISKAH